MPSVVVTMAAATMTAVAEKINAKIKPKAIFIDNVNAAADASLLFNDVFTPAASAGVPIPFAITVPRIAVNIGMGICQSLEDFLDEAEFLGTMQIVRGALDANCRITVIYDLQ